MDKDGDSQKEIVPPKLDQLIEDTEKVEFKELEAMIMIKTILNDDFKFEKKKWVIEVHMHFCRKDNLIVDLWTDENNYELWEPGLGSAKHDGGSVPVQ